MPSLESVEVSLVLSEGLAGRGKPGAGAPLEGLQAGVEGTHRVDIEAV
jgi:hypothetical protein